MFPRAFDSEIRLKSQDKNMFIAYSASYDIKLVACTKQNNISIFTYGTTCRL